MSKYANQKTEPIFIKITLELMIVSLFMGFLICGIAILIYPLISLYNLDASISAPLVKYASIRLYTMPLNICILVFFGLLFVFKKTWLCMKLISFGGILNIILSYLFVHVLNDDYALEHSVAYLAYATIVSEFVLFFVTYYTIHKYVIPIKFSIKIGKWLVVKDFIYLNLNLMLRAIAITFVFQFCNYLASQLDYISVSVQAILLNIFIINAFLMDGISSPILINAGRYFAYSDFRKLKSLNQRMKHLTFRASLFLVVLMLIMYVPLPYFFGNDKVFKDYFYSVFWMLIIIQPLCAYIYSFDSMFKSLGKGRLLRNILILSSLFFFPLSVVGIYFISGLNLQLIWFSFSFWILIRYFLSKYHEKVFFKTHQT